MTKPNIRRLEILADWLEKVPPERFDLSCWIVQPTPRDLLRGPSLDQNCGTVACALGWATACPAFRKIGLRLGGSRLFSFPEYQGWRGFGAAEILFGIKNEDARSLFDVCGYSEGEHTRLPTVIKRIRAFIAKHREPSHA